MPQPHRKQAAVYSTVRIDASNYAPTAPPVFFEHHAGEAAPGFKELTTREKIRVPVSGLQYLCAPLDYMRPMGPFHLRLSLVGWEFYGGSLE